MFLQGPTNPMTQKIKTDGIGWQLHIYIFGKKEKKLKSRGWRRGTQDLHVRLPKSLKIY